MNDQTQPKQGAALTAPPPVELPTRRPAEIRIVNDPIPVLDTARFEHMQRIATVMAHSNLIPDSLCMTGDKDNKELLPAAQINANCFLVVNQAVRWGLDPFAVAQCVSVVHGKLCYEGKLIAAVIEAKLGIRLKFKWDGKQGDALGIIVSGQFPDEDEPRIVTGTVGEWKTTGAGSPWTPKQSPKMLAYRGSREWGRLHSPSLLLGVYSDDELDALSDDRRARRAQEITAPDDDGPPAPPPRAVEHKPTDLEIVESGRDDGRQVEWGETAETTAPSTAPAENDYLDIPPALDRRPKPAAATKADPEAVLQWIEKKLAAIASGDALEAFWNDHIAPRLDDMFPPDREEAHGIYRKHEKRLAP